VAPAKGITEAAAAATSPSEVATAVSIGELVETDYVVVFL